MKTLLLNRYTTFEKILRIGIQIKNSGEHARWINLYNIRIIRYYRNLRRHQTGWLDISPTQSRYRNTAWMSVAPFPANYGHTLVPKNLPVRKLRRTRWSHMFSERRGNLWFPWTGRTLTAALRRAEDFLAAEVVL